METVLIFGASSGMAEAYARTCASQKKNLILVARDQEKLNILKEDLKIRGALEVQVYTLDFLDFPSHPSFLESIFSQKKIDQVLMAQGSMFDQKEAEQDFAKSLNMYQVNLLSVASLCNAMIPLFEKQKQGQIAVISSVAGDRGRASNFLYGSAKAAVQAYLSGLRGRLLSAHVNVIDIRPGFVATAMTAHLPQGPLFASPESVAHGISKAFRKRKSTVYLPWFWFFIMTIIRCIPTPIFKKLKF